MKKNKKEKKTQKVVYRANTKVLKKLIIPAILLLTIVILAGPIRKGVSYLYWNTWKWYDIEKYQLELKLPRAYHEVEISKKNTSEIVSSFFKTDSEVTVNQDYVSKQTEVVYAGESVLSGVSIIVQCLNVEKTTRTLSDLGDSQNALLKIYYGDKYNVGETKKEYITALETQALKASTDLSEKKDKGDITIINYLIPTEKEEVTVTFLGTKSEMAKANNEIESIISQMYLK